MSVTINHGEVKNIVIVEDPRTTIVIYNQNGIHSRFPAKTWEEVLPPTLPHNTPAQLAAAAPP